MKSRQTSGGNAIFHVRSSVLGNVAMEVNATAGVYRAYVYAGGKLVAQRSYDGQFYWMHQDHLGSGRKMTDATGAVKYRAEFDPYGQLVLSWSASGYDNLNSRRFTGYERDTAAGLDYANARMYSASGAGRFMQADPIGLKAADLKKPESLNRYSYVQNDPVNFVDRTGTLLQAPDGSSGGACQSMFVTTGWQIDEFTGERLSYGFTHVSCALSTIGQNPSFGIEMENSCHSFARILSEIASKYKDKIRNIDIDTGIVLYDPAAEMMNDIARRFTQFTSASAAGIAIQSLSGGGYDLHPNFGSDGFASDYYEANFDDGTRADQVKHAAMGLIAGYAFGATIGLNAMNFREDPSDPIHGRPDINLNGQTVPMGARLAGDEWSSHAGNLGNWVRSTLCQ